MSSDERRKLRILMPVDHAVGISGPHRNVVGSLNALTARDDVSVVLVTGKIDESEPYATSRAIDIRLGFDPHRPSRALSNLRLLKSASSGCDLIYTPTNLTSLIYAQALRFRRPLVAGPNVSHLPIHNRNDAPGMIELRLLSNAWFEASEMRRNHVRGVSGSGKIKHIHHSIDLEKFSPAHRDPAIWDRLGIPASTTKVIHVGRDNEPRKGVSQLLDAIASPTLNGRQDLDFVLVGIMSESTKARVDSMRNVSMLGFRSGQELAALYASADMAVVPSSWENFPFTVLEALASGLPVIASRTGGIPEMIVDGESGMLVDISAPDGAHKPDAGATLANAILALADDPDSRRQLGHNARRRAEEHFSETRLGEDLVQLFRSVFNKRDRG